MQGDLNFGFCKRFLFSLFRVVRNVAVTTTSKVYVSHPFQCIISVLNNIIFVPLQYMAKLLISITFYRFLAL